MNSKTNILPRSTRPSSVAWLTGFLTVMLAWPAAAGIEIPSDPLTSGARVAPNILFILDDSGSMGYFAMPADKTSFGDLGDTIQDKSYIHNTIYYDPRKTYRAWLKPDGETRWAGGDSYTSAYSSADHASGATTNLSNSTQTYFVPKPGATDLSKHTNFYRYQIRSVTRGAGRFQTSELRVVRSEYGTRNGSEGESGAGCSKWANNWQNCTFEAPMGRTEAQEMKNFAIWYSYHRTRLKAAKAGAGEAFSKLDGSVRVGFRTIWGEGNNDADPIPVRSGDGRFIDDPDQRVTNRTDWYANLYGAGSEGSTPLQRALNDAGQYFSRSDDRGPYGPETGGAQLSCRQNFAILTSDGYWNGTNAGAGNVDNEEGDVILGPRGQRYQYQPTEPYRDDYRNTLADLAMKYWATDLRTESYMGNATDPRNNNVPSSAANPAFWQHMVTFGISIGLKTSRGWSSVADVPENPDWPNPQTNKTGTGDAIPARIDDLLHAAVNGRGEFVTASSPEEFTAGLTTALATIAQRTSSSSNVAANSVSLDTGAQVFSASFVSGLWTGSLTATSVSGGVIANAPTWTASIPDWESRQIYTSAGNSGAAFPTADQLASLGRTGGVANFEVSATDNANYIKGDRSLEASEDGTLRDRTSLLGDIINSSPAYVRDTNTIYVGANDGMMHAFDAVDGKELFAYVPGIVNLHALSTLSRGDYTHRFLVDGPIVVSSHEVDDKNILVGTLGRGGKGLYALDVTDPENFGTSDVLWELEETPGNNMGLVLGKPLLTRVKGSTSAAVIVGNGVNSETEKAALIVINADTGRVVREISTREGSSDNPNGLFAPTGVLGQDGKTLAYVYAGDMLGNVWKFDLTAASPASWSVRKIFTAIDEDGNAQPITSALAIATHPTTHKRWVFFGTGRYLTLDDANVESVSRQSMYGFIDEDTLVSRESLTPRSIEVVDPASGNRAFEASGPLLEGAGGWYIDLPEHGERIVQDAQVVSNFLVTASMIPSGSACDADGSGYINALNAFTGTSARGSYFDIDGDGNTTDELVRGLPVGSINLGVGMPTLPNLLRGLLVVGGSGGGNPGGETTLQPRWDRASWREIRGE